MTNSKTFKRWVKCSIVTIFITALVFCAVAKEWPGFHPDYTPAYLAFIVSKIEKDRVLVSDNEGNEWWFDKPGFPCYKGLDVAVSTELHYLGEGKWQWDINNTELEMFKD